MASINQISIDLTFTGLDKIEQATKASRQFQREIRSLIREEKDGALTTAQFASRIGDLAGRLQKTTGNYDRAANAVFEYKNRVQEAIAQEKVIRDARAQAAANKALSQQYAREAAELAKVAQASQQYINSITMLERANKSAETSAELFIRQIERVDAANLKVAQAFGEAVRAANTYQTANKSAEASAEVFTRELARQEQQTMETARAHQQALRALRETALANKSAETSAESFSREMDRLQAKFNPLYAASQRYETALNELNRAKQLGVLNARQYDAALEDLNAQLAMGMTGMGGLGSVAGSTAQRMNRAGVITQQAGYQIGDFLVQVQSGTNAFVAFGQQATQVAGVLTLLGGKWLMIGTVLGIAIPLVTAIAAGFMRTREAAQDAGDGIETLASRLESARSEMGRMTLDIERLRRGFGDPQEFALVQGVEETQARILELQQQIYELEQLGTVTGPNERALAAARELLATRQQELETYRQQRQEQERLNALQERRTFFAEQTMELQNQVRLYRVIAQFGEDSSQAEAERARQAREAFRLEVMREGLYGQMLVDLMAQYDAMEDARQEAEAFAAVDMAAGVNAAADAAARLADNLAFARSLSPEFQANAVRAGVASGAIPPQALQDLPQTDAERAYQNLLENRRREAARVSAGSGGGRSGSAQPQEDYLLRLQEEAELRLRLIGLSEEEQRYLEISTELRSRGLPIEEERIRQLIATEEELRRATEAETRRQDLMNTVTQSIETALMGLIDGTQSVQEAFTGMIRAILQEIAMQAIVKPIASAITGSFFANGAAFSGGRVVPFASGGVVTGPTTFPMAGNQTGLMGEAGPEAIMPLTRTKGGKLGVVAEGGGEQPVVINQTFQFSANGDDSVKRIIAQEAPRIAALTQRQIVDQRRRGGTMKGAFG